MSQHWQTSRARAAANFISDFTDALIESEMALDVVSEIVIATSPVILEYAMKGALSE